MYSDGGEPTVFLMLMFMLLYSDSFVQNVYRACAYIKMNFTTNMIQYNFHVNVLRSDFSSYFYNSPDTDDKMNSAAYMKVRCCFYAACQAQYVE